MHMTLHRSSSGLRVKRCVVIEPLGSLILSHSDVCRLSSSFNFLRCTSELYESLDSVENIVPAPRGRRYTIGL